MNRRLFFEQFTDGFKTFLPSVLKANHKHSQVASQHQTQQLLIQSGEPINTNGEPFGGNITSAVLLEDAANQNYKILVVTHGLPAGGVTILEFEWDGNKQLWKIIYGDLNKRIHANIKVPLFGKFADQVFISEIAGPAFCQYAHLLPWKTVLVCEGFGQQDMGWLVEVNPRTGSSRKLFSCGRVFPISVFHYVTSGKPIELFYLGYDPIHKGTQLYQFKSSKPYLARHLNTELLNEGELFVADMQNKSWISISNNKEQWQQRMLNPALTPGFPKPSLNPKLGNHTSVEYTDITLQWPTADKIFITFSK